MNPTPDFHEAWDALRRHATNQLSPNFPDRVLRAFRAQTAAMRTATSELLVAACTAAACLLIVMLIHAHNTEQNTQAALTDWRQISAQADSLADLP